VIYADTSLLLPIYVPEANSELANRAVQGETELLISDLTVAEFLVGLARKVKLGTLPSERADEVRAAFEQHMSEGFLQRVALVGSHSEAAGQLASRSPVMLRTLDAIHLAVAVELEATLATLDGRLSDAAHALGVEVLPQP
jgi:predicted nucleic acid-binding protein